MTARTVLKEFRVSDVALHSAVRRIVEHLVRGEYARVVEDAAVSRLTADDLRGAISDYGKTLVMPPDSMIPQMDVVTVTGTDRPTWSVWVPLWSREDGRTDLTLALTVTDDGHRLRVEVDDLHGL
jgi:hypothetical protein